MIVETSAALRPRRPHVFEMLPDASGGAEVVLARSRRVRLNADARWLLERIDGRADVATLAAELAARFGREVSAEDALALMRGTLGAHGLVEIPVAGREAPSAPLRNASRGVLLPAPLVRAWARALATAAHPLVAALLGASALLALALLARAALGAGAAPWRTPLAWAIALPLAALAFVAHELGHAAALVHAGGTPGAIAIVWTSGRPRLACELAGLESLPRGKRAAIDVAGAFAQVLVAGAAAGPALALGAAPLVVPACALVVAMALVELLPVPGTDGAWLLADLAGEEPGDALQRPTSPVRWLHHAAVRANVRVRYALGRFPAQAELAVLPVFVSTSFPHWSPRRLRAHARGYVEMQGIGRHDQLELPRGGRAERVRHVRPIRTLLGEGRGAVVCAMHVGPYPYVCEALMSLGVRLMAYAAPNQQQMWAGTWDETVRNRGFAFELLSPRSARDAVRAVRGLREGKMLFLLMDGQNATQRDQHRADFTFMGQSLYMRTGAALLARRAGVPLVLAATRYEGVATRVVEFSDPLPPPESDDDDALVARTSEMFAWFEPRVAPVAEQWDGWIWPVVNWHATGGAPTATPEAIDAAMREAREAIVNRAASARVVAEPTRVQWMQSRGERLVVHAATRRVLVVSPLACGVLDAAFRRTRVADLPRATGAHPDALVPELARMTLAGLVALER